MNELVFKEKYNLFSSEIESYRDRFSSVIPEGMRFDVIKSSIESEFIKNPDLLLCSVRSVVSAIKTVVNVGLIPNSNTGQCYFIPFKNSNRKDYELNVILGYRGLADLIYRSALVKDIEVRAVFKGDDFDYWFGLKKDVKHKPCGNTRKEDLTHVYCIINLNTGGEIFDVMTLDEINIIRDQSANYKHAKKNKFEEKTIWNIHFIEMAKKSVLRRISKIAPISVEARNMIGIDELADIGKQNILEQSYKDPFFKENAFNDIQEAEIVSSVISNQEEKISEINKLKKEVKHEATIDALDQLKNIVKNKNLIKTD